VPAPRKGESACKPSSFRLRGSAVSLLQGHRQWIEAGDLLARVLELRPDLKTKLSALVNDCLLALSARDIGATLYTRNRDDFTLLRKVRPFSLVIVN
jgi:predicted nucleic acid-binding protein